MVAADGAWYCQRHRLGSHLLWAPTPPKIPVYVGASDPWPLLPREPWKPRTHPVGGHQHLGSPTPGTSLHRGAPLSLDRRTPHSQTSCLGARDSAGLRDSLSGATDRPLCRRDRAWGSFPLGRLRGRSWCVCGGVLHRRPSLGTELPGGSFEGEAVMWKPQEAAGLAPQIPGLGWSSGHLVARALPGQKTAPFFVLKLHSTVFSGSKLEALLWKVLCAGGSWASTYFIS